MTGTLALRRAVPELPSSVEGARDKHALASRVRQRHGEIRTVRPVDHGVEEKLLILCLAPPLQHIGLTGVLVEAIRRLRDPRLEGHETGSASAEGPRTLR